jgi:formate/nitrite transporter FocA (FNT family)
MLSSCNCESADDEVSLASASLISICIIGISSLLFGVILGMGWMFTSAMQTADSQNLGFSLILVGLLGFILTMVIVVVRNERLRTRVLVNKQSGF